MICFGQQIQKPKYYQKFKEVINYSTRCQVCLSYQKQVQSTTRSVKDQLISCDLCMSSIHQQHYGSQLLSYSPGNSKWFCQRCRYLLKNKDNNNKISIQCQFCPAKKGIMKLIECDKRKVWSHLECIIWDYPLRTFGCRKFEFVKKFNKSNIATQRFWNKDFPDKKCKLCESPKGQFIKCKYYSCSTYYHVTCAKKLGVVRELQKMRIQSVNIYIPVYCSEHLQKRGKDFRKKATNVTEKQKQKHFIQLAKIYEDQYQDLKQAEILEKSQTQPIIIYVQEQQSEQQQKIVEQNNESAGESRMNDEKSKYNSSLCEYLQKQLEIIMQKQEQILKVIKTIQNCDQNIKLIIQSEQSSSESLYKNKDDIRKDKKCKVNDKMKMQIQQGQRSIYENNDQFQWNFRQRYDQIQSQDLSQSISQMIETIF